MNTSVQASSVKKTLSLSIQIEFSTNIGLEIELCGVTHEVTNNKNDLKVGTKLFKHGQM